MPKCPTAEPADPMQPVEEAVETLTRAIRIALDTLTPAETATVLTEHGRYLKNFADAQDAARRKVILQTLSTAPVATDFGRRP